jgi:Domain of unknown function (DUF5658)
VGPCPSPRVRLKAKPGGYVRTKKIGAAKYFPERHKRVKKLWVLRGLRKGTGSGVLFLIILISGLNVLDSVLTLMLLDLGAVEANPIVGAAIQVFGDHFWVWKYGIVSASSLILCCCGKRTSVKISLIFIALVYSAVVIYQIALLGHHGF